LFSAATACIQSSGAASSRTSTAAELPVKGPEANASTCHISIDRFRAPSSDEATVVGARPPSEFRCVAVGSARPGKLPAP
jgi:hypothetical protein